MRAVLTIAGGTIYLGAIVWPAAALVWSSIAEGAAPRDGFVFSAGQFALLARTFFLALCAAAMCLPPAVAAGVLVFSRRRSAIFLATLGAGLMCPPMIYAFGWLRLFPHSIPPEVKCVAVWVLWAWPIGAIIVGSGWARTGRSAYEAALLCTGPASAFLRIGLPALRFHLWMTFLLGFVLFFGDYGVPHAFGLRVHATELLAWSTESDRTIDALWPALPSVAVTALVLALVFLTSRRCGGLDAIVPFGAPRLVAWGPLVLTLMVAGWLLPLLALCKPLTPAIAVEAVRTYGADMMMSLAVSGTAGVLVLLSGIALGSRAAAMGGWLFPALLFGALPGALVGQALVAGYNNAALGWLYDHWPVVALVYVARYAWIGLLVVGLVARSKADRVADLARVDGATETQVLIHVLLPQHAPLLLGTGAIVVALAMGDAAASAIVRVPGYNPIAYTIIEKFHRLEDGMLISLSLMLLLVASLGAGLTAWAYNKIRQ